MKKQEKEFDRSVCFTFYNSFHEQIMDVKRDFGLEQAFEVYEAIVNYGLYGKEIEKGKLRTLVGNATIEKVEGSQANREKWFDGENFEQTRLVAEYMRDHPNTSQRTIAAATGVGKTKVGKVQKSIRESEFDSIQDYLVHIVYPHLNVTDNGNNCNNSNNIVTETEGDQRDQSLKSLSTTELADAQTVASTMPIKEFDFKSDSSFSDKDMAKIIGNFIKQGHSKTDVITEFTNPKGWYKCSNEQAVIDCYDYLTKAD